MRYRSREGLPSHYTQASRRGRARPPGSGPYAGRRARFGRRAGADPRQAPRALAERPAHRGLAARARGRGAVPDGGVARARCGRLQGGRRALRLAPRLRRLRRAQRGDGRRGLAAPRPPGRGRAHRPPRPPARSLALGLPRRPRGHAQRDPGRAARLRRDAAPGRRRAHVRVRPAQVGEPRGVRLLPAQPARPERAADRARAPPRWPTSCSTSTPATACS